MPGLTFGQGRFGFAQWDYCFFRGQKFFQEIRFVMTAAALVVAPQRFSHLFRVEPEFAGEIFKEQFHQSYQRDAVGTARARVKPVTETEKTMEGRM